MISPPKSNQINVTVKKEFNEMNTSMVDSKKLTTIHVVSSTETVPLRNLTVLRNPISSGDVITDIKQSQPLTTGKAEVYQQRRRMVLECKDLFTALMRLADKELQKKLLDVINNHQAIEYKTVGTQTDPVEFKEPSVYHQSQKMGCVAENNSSEVNITSISGEAMKKRKRKRKVSSPQANKESRSKQLAKMNKPKILMGNIVPMTVSKVEPAIINSQKRQRISSFCVSECTSDVANIYEDTETNHSKEIEQCSFPLENGLLPIQDAVLRNQTNKLNMHIVIWQSCKGVDLNDILTEEDEDLLQLAVLNTCDPSIVSLLLKRGLNPNTLDADSNTLIHLAILNDITVSSLDHLMKHVDLKLLLSLNDDGYTPLHLAIRQDRYLLAECLINVLDKRLINKIFFKRPVDELETDEIVLKKQFKEYYESICLKLSADSDDETDSCSVINPDLKQKLLQVGDRRSGNTALYFALDNKYEHLIYFLLAHLTDPRTENLSGLDCKAYFCEFGKSLNLRLNIEIIMNKVIQLLS